MRVCSGPRAFPLPRRLARHHPSAPPRHSKALSQRATRGLRPAKPPLWRPCRGSRLASSSVQPSGRVSSRRRLILCSSLSITLSVAERFQELLRSLSTSSETSLTQSLERGQDGDGRQQHQELELVVLEVLPVARGG